MACDLTLEPHREWAMKEERWDGEGGREGDFRYKTSSDLPEERELSDLLRVEGRGQPLKSLGCHFNECHCWSGGGGEP